MLVAKGPFYYRTLALIFNNSYDRTATYSGLKGQSKLLIALARPLFLFIVLLANFYDSNLHISTWRCNCNLIIQTFTDQRLCNWRVI